MAARVHLIGCVHNRPRGLVDLLAALNRSGLARGRTLVSVEVSPLSLTFRRRWSPALAERLSACLDQLAAESGRPVDELWATGPAAGLALFLRPPYEFTAARRWSGPGRVRLIEPAADSARRLARVWEMFSPDNLKKALTRPAPPAGSGLGPARLALETNLVSPGADDAREDRLARRISALVRPGRDLIHIGGWEHLPGLRRRLAGLKPTWDLADHRPHRDMDNGRLQMTSRA